MGASYIGIVMTGGDSSCWLKEGYKCVSTELGDPKASFDVGSTANV